MLLRPEYLTQKLDRPLPIKGKAWEAVQASGVIYPEDKVELVRAILAKHIIAAAKDGERDHSRLCDGALLALAQSNLRSVPRPLR
jgi:hypothetical protein